MRRQLGLLAIGLVAFLTSSPLRAEDGVKVKTETAKAAGDAKAAKPRKVTTVEGITEYAYDNGFRALLFPDASKPTVTVNLTLFVGSRQAGKVYAITGETKATKVYTIASGLNPSTRSACI